MSDGVPDGVPHAAPDDVYDGVPYVEPDDQTIYHPSPLTWFLRCRADPQTKCLYSTVPNTVQYSISVQYSTVQYSIHLCSNFADMYATHSTLPDTVAMIESPYQQWLHQQQVVAATQPEEETPPVWETVALTDEVGHQLQAGKPLVFDTGAAPEENWAMGADWLPMSSQARQNQQPASADPQQAYASQHPLHYVDVPVVLAVDYWQETRALRREVHALHEMVDLVRQEVNGLHEKLDLVLHTIKKNSNKIHLIHPAPPDPPDDVDPPDPPAPPLSQVIVYDPPPPPGWEYQ